jgi:ribokinase
VRQPAPGGVLVIGSVNRDRILRVTTRPAAGSTVLATGMATRTGGKGANQAVAAVRAGAVTRLVGCVGDDADGREALADLTRAGVDISGVIVAARSPSGSAFVTVTPDGENAIVVEPGSNALLRPADAAEAIASCRSRRVAEGVVVTQAEIPAAVVDRAAAAAAAAGIRFVYNLAPYRPVSEPVLRLCDPLVVNEGEAAALVGHPLGSVGLAQATAVELASACRSVVVTLGPAGAVLADDRGPRHVPATPVDDVVDTTGAGDAFVGAMAAALAAAADLDSAVTAGARAAAAVISRGAGSLSSAR